MKRNGQRIRRRKDRANDIIDHQRHISISGRGLRVVSVECIQLAPINSLVITMVLAKDGANPS
jgi:hypothetical protein